MNVLIINGPNLNLLGTRETTIYGSDTLAKIEERCQDKARASNIRLKFEQSNHEGEIVELIHQAISDSTDALIINAGAYTHTSIAIHDALKIFSGYKVELHISNPHLRENFRHNSYISPAVDVVIAGLGACAYDLVIEQLPDLLKNRS